MQKLLEIVRGAGELMLSFADVAVTSKGRHADFVTEADVAVQNELMEKLARAFPGAAFFAEEQEGNRLGDGLTFIIDPIDGTTNYFRRRRCSAVSVAAVQGGELLMGAILDPYRKEMYHASAGGGAWCNDVRLHVSDTPMERALIGVGSSPYNTELAERTGRTVAAILPAAGDIRRTGSACMDLCDVACGRSEAYFEWILQPWDYAAATLLVREAGGVCGGMLQGDVRLDGPMAYLAATPRTYDALQAIFRRIAAE